MFEKTIKMLIGLVIVVTISSCERRSCNNVTCPTGQTCYSGACLCTDGYEGADCNTLSSDKYVGSYNVYESCYSSNCNFCQYTVSIYADPNYADRIHIIPLFNQGECIAYIHNYGSPNGLGNSIEIPYQNIGALSFSGTGTFNPSTNQMQLNLNYTFNGGTYQCTQTLYKF